MQFNKRNETFVFLIKWLYNNLDLNRLVLAVFNAFYLDKDRFFWFLGTLVVTLTCQANCYEETIHISQAVTWYW